MAQIEINSLYTSNGIPTSGLSPTIRIWEVDGAIQTLIVGFSTGTGQATDGAMTEIFDSGSPPASDGFYTFLFTDTIGYDPTKKYLIRTDGGASLPDADRYQSGAIDPIEENIINGVWDEELAPDHLGTGTAGLILSEVKADTTALSLDLTDVEALVSLLLKYDTNRTKIDDTTKTLTVYDDDCVTVLRTFQLLDQNGNPSTDSVCERKPISSSDGKPVCP
jgi:hypothetical protein